MSQASLLNSRIDTGPSINTTKRTDCNLACRLAAEQADVDGTALDVHPGDLVLAEANSLDVGGMQTCIGKDTVKDEELADDPNSQFGIRNGAGDFGTMQLDQRAAQYYRDVGDARSGLEYFLRYNQVVLLFKRDGHPPLDPETIAAIQPHLKAGWTNDRPNNAIPTTRKNIFIFSGDADNTALFADPIPANAPGPTVIDLNDVVRVTQGGVLTANAYNFNGLHVYYIHISQAAATEMQAFLYLNAMKIITHILTSRKPDCAPMFKTNRPSGNAVPVINLNSAGISLTHGHMSSRNGDTAFTSNIFSARTDVNGPFKTRAGDDIFWIYNCEARMFDKRTFERHERIVLTEELLQQILYQTLVQNAAVAIPPYTAPTKENCLHIELYRTQRPGTGNVKYPNFVVAARQHKVASASLMYLTSLRDCERIVGKVISGGDPYASIDWVHGASTEM
tara:strand:- start:215 stop:1564 length:1350 start_codon:yes stop_codon:yes gene_type:complete